MSEATPLPRELRKLPIVCRQTALSRANVYRLVKLGEFPAPVKLGQHARASAWVGTEVDAWIAQRIAQRDLAA